MDIFNAIAMLGGLALFLYGMTMLGDGLAAASGGKLEKILEKLVGSRVKAVIVGAGVTALIQSSSATTVMVVGFVNSGIMKLSQAVGIIMGANVGTTVTSWILSMTGIEATSVIGQLLKPTNFSPLFAFVGIVMLMFSKKEQTKHISTIFVGFAILMTGMDGMSAAVKPLADIPEFTNILTMFSNPICGLLAGAVLTAIIQSSSASVGILQALAISGAMGMDAAIPIIMGQNIGTCVTALISSIGAKKNAKRVAFVHLYFNIIGTIIFMMVFYTLDLFVDLPFMGQIATPVDIAIVHSIFNIFATIILLPFSDSLVKLAKMTVTDVEDKKEKTRVDILLDHLDPRFLEKPSYAIEQAKYLTNEMARLSCMAIDYSIDILKEYDEKKAQEVVDLEDDVDKLEDHIASYLLQVGSRSLSEHDNNMVSLLLHSIGDFERISDHARNVKESADEINIKKIEFTEQTKNELEQYQKAIRNIIDMTLRSFTNEDLKLARQVEPLEDVIDELNMEIRQRHVIRLREGKTTIENGFVITDIITNFERVSDHCSNVAIALLEISQNGCMEAHAYLHQLRKENNPEFRECMEEYRQLYSLD